jgi:hypothetical protein
MKKALFVIIILMIGLAFVSAQDTAKLEALERELEALEAKVDRGQMLTQREIQRIQEIQQEAMMEAMKAAGPYGNLIPQFQQQQNQNAQSMSVEDIQRQQQATQQFQQMLQQGERQEQQRQNEAQMYPGETRGWPSASIFSQCSMPALRQPAGTNVSYTYDSERRTLTLYATNSNQAAFNSLVQAIENGGKTTYKEFSEEGNTAFFGLPLPSGLDGGRRGSGHMEVHYQVRIELEGGTITLVSQSRVG